MTCDRLSPSSLIRSTGSVEVEVAWLLVAAFAAGWRGGRRRRRLLGTQANDRHRAGQANDERHPQKSRHSCGSPEVMSRRGEPIGMVRHFSSLHSGWEGALNSDERIVCCTRSRCHVPGPLCRRISSQGLDFELFNPDED